MSSEIYVQKFMEDYKFRLNPKTIQIYQGAVNQLLLYCQKPLEAITRRDIKGWLNHLYQKGNKVSTVYTKLVGVKQFYSYCKEEMVINKDPAENIELPQVDVRIPHYLTREKLNRLRKHVEINKEERAIIEVLYSTGVRISELASMKLEDIQWNERMIFIRNGKGKRERMVLFSQSCAEHLKAYLSNRKDELPYVFVNPRKNNHINVRTIEKKFENYTKELGMKVTPHTMRHTFAAHLARKGMRIECIQELLGHDSPQQTRLYAKLYDHARKEMYDEIT